MVSDKLVLLTMAIKDLQGTINTHHRGALCDSHDMVCTDMRTPGVCNVCGVLCEVCMVLLVRSCCVTYVSLYICITRCYRCGLIAVVV